MDQQITGKQPEMQQSEREAELAAEATVEAMTMLSPERRGYFQGFLMGLQTAEAKKAG